MHWLLWSEPFPRACSNSSVHQEQSKPSMICPSFDLHKNISSKRFMSTKEACLFRFNLVIVEFSVMDLCYRGLGGHHRRKLSHHGIQVKIVFVGVFLLWFPHIQRITLTQLNTYGNPAEEKLTKDLSATHQVPSWSHSGETSLLSNHMT